MSRFDAFRHKWSSTGASSLILFHIYCMYRVFTLLVYALITFSGYFHLNGHLFERYTLFFTCHFELCLFEGQLLSNFTILHLHIVCFLVQRSIFPPFFTVKLPSCLQWRYESYYILFCLRPTSGLNARHQTTVIGQSNCLREGGFLCRW